MSELDLDALERQWQGLTGNFYAGERKVILALIQRLRQLEAYRTEAERQFQEKVSEINTLDIRIAQLEHVREAAQAFSDSTWTGESFRVLRAALAAMEEPVKL